MSQGNIVYHGKQKNLIPYFTSLGYPCPVHQNPLDHYSKLLTPTTNVGRRSRGADRQNLKDFSNSRQVPHKERYDPYCSLHCPSLLYYYTILLQSLWFNLLFLKCSTSTVTCILGADDCVTHVTWNLKLQFKTLIYLFCTILLYPLQLM